MSVLGLDIGASRLRAVWLDGEELARLDIWHTPGPAELLALLQEVRNRLPRPPAQLGVGLAGAAEDGVITGWPNRPEYVGFGFAAACARAFGAAPLVLDDCAAAALGEHHARPDDGTASTLYVGIGTGIGAGAVLQGRLHLGARRRAFDLGHLPVGGAAEVRCRCGRWGCLQAVASGRALAERTAATAPLGQAALAGDEQARSCLAGAGRSIGEAIAGAARLLDPDRVVIGGGLTEAGRWLLEPVARGLREHHSDVTLEVARLGPWSGAIGAALWACPSEQRPQLQPGLQAQERATS